MTRQDGLARSSSTFCGIGSMADSWRVGSLYTATPLRAIGIVALLAVLPIAVSASGAGSAASPGSAAGTRPGGAPGAPTFQTSDRCLACHNGLTSAAGENVSIGSDWRTSLMANSARDPYWQASVRRETLEHAVASGPIEDECAVCHMPIPRYEARLSGRTASVFAHLPLQANRDRKASDGVSCFVCDPTTPENLGDPASF